MVVVKLGLGLMIGVFSYYCFIGVIVVGFIVLLLLL